MVDNQLDNLDFLDAFGGEDEDWGLDGNIKPAEKPVAKADTFKFIDGDNNLFARAWRGNNQELKDLVVEVQEVIARPGIKPKVACDELTPKLKRLGVITGKPKTWQSATGWLATLKGCPGEDGTPTRPFDFTWEVFRRCGPDDVRVTPCAWLS
jgi:hypothetical protein